MQQLWFVDFGLVVGLTAVLPAPAQYLDPGAGSMVIQVIIAGLVGLAATVGFYWRKLASIFARKSEKRPDS